MTKKLLQTVLSDAAEKLLHSNTIHEDLKQNLEENGFQVISRVNSSCSTPRIIFICEDNRNRLIEKLVEHNVECGTWFDFPPVVKNLLEGSKKMFSRYLNLPCNYTLTSKQVSKIKDAVNEFSS